MQYSSIMHIMKIGGNLKALTIDRWENMGGCPCFPRRRRKVKRHSNNIDVGVAQEQPNNLKTPATPTVQTIDSERKTLQEQSQTRHEQSKLAMLQQSQARHEEEESKTKWDSKIAVVLEPAAIDKVRQFSYQELANATKNFKRDAYLGEGGFGPVYKGLLQSTGQVVAVKTLNQEGVQGNDEFEVEVTMLSLVCHPNIVTLIGYCSERDKRLLVYEFMPLGSLEQHLHYPRPDMDPLDWITRMKIATGAARGLNYLHNHCKPRIIYRDMKSANILLGDGYHAKLSDLGLAKFGPTGEKSHVSTRVMGTMGYCAPEYGYTGQLTVKSDTYSFGVVLLELVTGRKALDKTSDGEKQQLLIEWARPMLTDRKKYVKLADPRMKGQFGQRPFRKAIDLALMCMHIDHRRRPDMGDVVDALDFLVSLSEPVVVSDEVCTGGSHGSTGGGGGGGVEGEGQRCHCKAAKVKCGQLGNGQKTDDVGHIVKAKDEERARAVAEAKKWGEKCRQDAEKLASPRPFL